MTKKILKPQQAAPVQREITTASSVGGTGLTPNITGLLTDDREIRTYGPVDPFAGDDAE